MHRNRAFALAFFFALACMAPVALGLVPRAVTHFDAGAAAVTADTILKHPEFKPVMPAEPPRPFVCRDFNYTNRVGPVAPFVGYATMIANFTNHIAIVVKTDEELAYVRAAYDAAGIGPWLPVNRIRNTNAFYCGQFMPGTFNIDIYLTTSRFVNLPFPSFWEIFKLVDDTPNLFRDWYNQHGPSIVYQGLQVIINNATGQPIVDAAGFEAWMAERQIPTVFHFGFDAPPGGRNAYFVRIGYHLAEFVFINP
jgi:hypothetical protein